MLTKTEIHALRMKMQTNGKWKPSKRISITDETFKNIEIICEEECKSKSKVVEEAVQHWIELKRNSEREY